jgi:hemoglobin/transferrin/lactoferrin receptor protein
MPQRTAVPYLPVVFLTAGFFLWSAAAPAEEDVDSGELIDQIVVVAHKDERSIREVAANVTVVSRATLKDQMALSTSDLFRYVSGVDYEAAGTRFGTEGINIRGIGGNRVAILVDGVPLSDHFAVGSFSNATRDFLDSGLIQGVEVLHGPASALYGSAAIGGVVSVRTPDPIDIAGRDGIGGDALATFRSSDASYHGQAMFGLGDAALGFLAGISSRDGQELDAKLAPSNVDTRDYERQTALLKFVADDPWGHTWRASLINQRANTRSDLNSMLGAGRFRSTTALEGDDQYRMNALNVAWEFGSPESWFDTGIVRAYFEQADIEQTTLDERAAARTPVSIDRLFTFDQEIRGVEVNLWREFTGLSTSHRLGFGAEYRERRSEELRDGLSTNLATGEQSSVLLGEVFPLRDFPISVTKETSAFVEDTFSYGRWTVIAALRADRFELSPSADPVYVADYPFAELVTIDESDVSPKLGLIYKLTPGTDIYVQYSHGFRAPPYSDANIGLDIPFFNYRAIPNPELKSETSNGFDVGVRWHGQQSTARLSVFRTRYDDFIESKVRLGIDAVSGRILFQSQNLRATVIEGIEAAWSLRWGALGIDGSAYYASGENRENNQPLNSVGPSQAMLGVSFYSASERTRLQLKASFTDAWDKRDETRGELFKPAGHAVIDAFLTQAIRGHSTLRVGLHNITDRGYWHWADVRGLAADDPNLPFLSRAGRSASVSLNVIW